ncbi:MAG: aldolase/citrate lyase family protein [SAR324 cluster bacterium]|jgi:4-hydroxy-2-oxoheptanedioate aldolase|nr:2,4-dihydroxyhept-2-ene-1,7-dioic acid aldolase [Deltaproteobacteria bacterium]MEC7418301.1 aldolase/citrate lyase family protein [SAR324 cluster bacterium]HIL14596.1 2,4-dihydroxyhept-2-ene-1,7-dioic acid aldolase [Deltaproteobacteria bacterium]
MRENLLKTKWESGGWTLNGWLGIPSSISAEMMAQAGWDSLTVDLQHGLIDYTTALPMLQAISTTSVVPLARVPWNEPGIIMKLLDAGCYGIICPMINTREQAEAFVRSSKYPPLGERSWGPHRAQLYAGSGYREHANTTTLALAMIETREALENIDAILSTPGLDGCYIGPSDLGLSLGYEPKPDREEPELLEAIDLILTTAKRNNVRACMHCGSTAYAKRMIEQGFDSVTILADNHFILHGARQVVNEMKP